MTNGYFTCYILGHVIIIDVIPDASYDEKRKFAEDLSESIKNSGNTYYFAEIDHISKLDIFYTRYNGFKSPAVSDVAAYMPYIEEPTQE